jgi:outer membrane protein OmpA-like peptidoglycan-associated protein
MAGITGATGATGPAGPQGAVGPTGGRGPAGSQGSTARYEAWSTYAEYTFNNSDQILRSDSNKARELAYYMQQNPSYQIGLDGMNENRVRVVRNELIGAGVPADKIRRPARMA